MGHRAASREALRIQPKPKSEALQQTLAAIWLVTKCFTPSGEFETGDRLRERDGKGWNYPKPVELKSDAESTTARLPLAESLPLAVLGRGQYVGGG
jgi:hypothetical protein